MDTEKLCEYLADQIRHLHEWIQDELDYGSRIKASRLNRVRNKLITRYQHYAKYYRPGRTPPPIVPRPPRPSAMR